MSQSKQKLEMEEGSTSGDSSSRSSSPGLVLMDDDTMAFFEEVHNIVSDKHIPSQSQASTSGTSTGLAKMKQDSRSKTRASKSGTPTASGDAKIKQDSRSKSGDSTSGTRTASGDAKLESGHSKSNNNKSSGIAKASDAAEIKHKSRSNSGHSESGTATASGNTAMKRDSCFNSDGSKSGTSTATGETEIKNNSCSKSGDSKSGTTTASCVAEMKHKSSSNSGNSTSEIPLCVEEKCESSSELGACASDVIPVNGNDRKRKIHSTLGHVRSETPSTSGNVKGRRKVHPFSNITKSEPTLTPDEIENRRKVRPRSRTEASTSTGAVKKRRSPPDAEVSPSVSRPTSGNGKKRKHCRDTEDSTLETPPVSGDVKNTSGSSDNINALTPEVAKYIGTVFPELCQKHYFEDVCCNILCKSEHIIDMQIYEKRLKKMNQKEFMELFQFALNQARIYQELYPILLKNLLEREYWVEFYHSVYDFKRLIVDVNKALYIFLREFIIKYGLNEATRSILCNFQLIDFPQIGFELFIILSKPDNLTKYWRFAKEILRRIQNNETIQFRLQEYLNDGLIHMDSFERLSESLADTNELVIPAPRLSLTPSNWSILPVKTVASIFPVKPIVGVKRCRKNYVLNRSLHDLFPFTRRRSNYNGFTRTFFHIVQAVKCTNAPLFLEWLNRNRHENYIDDFAMLCVKCIFALLHSGVHKFYSLCVAIRRGKYDCRGDQYLKATLEVVVMNLLVFLEEKSRLEEACKFIGAFKDWDSLVTSRIIYNKSFSQMGRYFLLAKILAKSKKFEHAFNIIIVPTLHLLEAPDKWPYCYVDEDLVTREEVLTEIYKHALILHPVEVKELLHMSFTYKHLEAFSEVKLKEILQSLLETEQYSTIKLFLEYPTFSKYIPEEFYSVIGALVDEEKKE